MPLVTFGQENWLTVCIGLVCRNGNVYFCFHPVLNMRKIWWSVEWSPRKTIPAKNISGNILTKWCSEKLFLGWKHLKLFKSNCTSTCYNWKISDVALLNSGSPLKQLSSMLTPSKIETRNHHCTETKIEIKNHHYTVFPFWNFSVLTA